jgi:hypothetical protein
VHCHRNTVIQICVAFGHRPDGVEVIGQNDHCVDRERMTPPRFAK